MKYFINTDRKLLPKPGRTAKKISIDDFKKLLLDCSLKNDEDGNLKELIDESSSDIYNSWQFLKGILSSSTIFKDLQKVYVDTENYEIIEIEEREGLTYLSAWVGGDWEVPVFIIVYWDGKKLRGYIPKYGNAWNPLTNEALGNNWTDKYDLAKGEEAGLDNILLKKYQITGELYDIDIDFCEEDCLEDCLCRIKVID
jgi:hypothetical protein